MSKIIKCWNCENEVPRIEYKNYNGIPVCNKCGVQYPEKPKTEAELTILQDEYLSNRNDKTLGEMFKIIQVMVFNIITSKLKGQGRRVDYEQLEDMVSWTVCKLISYYKEKPTFKISGSFTGYISQVVLYPLHNSKDKEKEQMEMSINTPLDDGEEKKTLLDLLSSQSDIEEGSIIENEFVDKLQLNYIMDYINDFIELSINSCFKKSIDEKYNDYFSRSVMLLLLYKHYISKKNDRFFSEVWRTSPIEVRENFEKTLELMKQSLIEELNGN